MTASSFIDLLAQAPQLIVIMTVIIIDWMMPFPGRYSPERALTSFAKAIADKLRLQRQGINHSLYGVLALLCYGVLVVIILFACLFAFKNDMLTQGLLLYLSLSVTRHERVMSHLAHMIKHNQKAPARALLATSSPFDNNKLSSLGMTKMGVEQLIFRFFHGWIMPILLFSLFGGATSFMYMVLVSAQITWLPYNAERRQFGQFAMQLRDTIAFIPTLVLLPTFSVFKSSPGWFNIYQSVRVNWFAAGWSKIDLAWLSVTAAGLKCELGGPLMLNNQKLARPRVLQHALTTVESINQTRQWIARFKIFTIFMLSLLFIVLTLR